MTLEDLGVDGMLQTTALQGRLESGSLKASTRAASLEHEGVGFQAQAQEVVSCRQGP
jgi:hypothetical protein